MPEEPKKKDLFQKLVGWFKDAQEWVEETFADPALTAALKEDLGLNTTTSQPPPGTPPAARAKIDEFLAKEDIDEAALLETVAQVVVLVHSIRQFADTLKAEGMDVDDVVWLVARVAAADSLRVRVPAIYAVAKLLLFISDDADSLEMLDPARLARMLRNEPQPPNTSEDLLLRIWSSIGLLLMIAEHFVDKYTDSEGRLDAFYGWDPEPGSTAPKADSISQRAATILTTFPTTPAATVGLTALSVPREDGGPGLFVALSGGVTYPFVTGNTRIEIKVGATGAFWMFIPFKDAVQPFRVAGDPAGFVKIDVRPNAPTTEPALRAGSTKGTRLEIGAFGFGIEVGQERAGVRIAFIDAKLVINLGEGDGFISKLGGGGLEIPFAIGMTVDTQNGLRFDGGSGLRVNLPVSATLFGVFTVQYLELALAPTAGSGLGVELSGGFSLKLGPFKASVDRLGLIADTAKLDNGNIGSFMSMIAFKPPNGIGLLLDAGLVKGGGYLFIDHQRGEYAGTMELAIKLPVAGNIGIKAIGILSTKLPDGHPGWALLIMVFVEFRIQLSFGFTLLGFGGILGLHHRPDTQALGDGLKTGVMDDILFPRDPVADAPRIINRLRVVFPIQQNTLTLGPAIEVGWGTPTLVDIKLAVLLEIDNALGGGPASLSKIVLLGQFHLQLPSKDLDVPAIVKILVDVLGVYDADEDWLYIRARLRDSFIGVGGENSPTRLSLTGELLVSMQFGDDPHFVISAGGFHPKFKDLPKKLPAVLDRLGISFPIQLLRLKIEIYIAMTSNTVQVGLNVELVAKLGPVEIKGWLGFDALFIFEPEFHFIVDVRFGVSVKFKSFNLCAIDVRASLEGPGKWHAIGHASFSVLWWDVPIDFDESWGGAPQAVEGTVSASQALIAEVNRPSNWSAQLPAGSDQLVTLAKHEGLTGIVAHPLGQLQFVQRVVPLGLDIVRIGERSVEGARRFDIGTVTVGTRELTAPQLVTEHFARAHFVDRTEEQKLSDESFERFTAGAAVGTTAYTASEVPSREVIEHEERYLEPDDAGTGWVIHPGIRFALEHTQIVSHAAFGGAARSPRAVIDRLKGHPERQFAVNPPPMAIANESKLTAVDTALEGITALSPSLAAQVAATVPGATLVEAYELEGVL